MRLEASVGTSNIDSLIEKKLKPILDDIDGELLKTANFARDVAKSKARFKSGRLQSSIRRRKSKFQDGGYIVFTKDQKSHLIEYGHVKVLWGRRTGERVRPFPFMRIAGEQGRVYLAGLVGKIVGRKYR